MIKSFKNTKMQEDQSKQSTNGWFPDEEELPTEDQEQLQTNTNESDTVPLLAKLLTFNYYLHIF